MIEARPRRSLPEPDPRSVANALYLVWGAIGFSILAEFGLLLYLQRAGHVRIADAGGPWRVSTHLTLVLALAAAALLLLRTLRARLRDPAALLRGARGGSPPFPGRSGGSPDPTSSAAAAFAGAPPGRVAATRFVGVSVLQWAVAETLALLGLTVALAVQPAPRAALVLYFTLALALWVWYRPDLPALSEVLRRARQAS